MKKKPPPPGAGVSTRFTKGRSGNPGGRPKGSAEFKTLCQQHTPEALAAVVAIMKSKKAHPGVRLDAAKYLIDRGWGKPATAIDVTGAEGKAFGVVILPPEEN